MSRLFGTDGIRGAAGEPPLDPDTVRLLGRVLALRISRGAGAARPPRLLVGRDTRESGPALEQSLAEGFAEAGGIAVLAGVLPTPAVAMLVAGRGFDAGVAISASHNPWRDNGIKVIGAGGRKLPDSLEEEIERDLRSGPGPRPRAGGRVEEDPSLRDAYVERTAALAPDLGGIRLVLDCANGAATTTAARIFGMRGARVEVLHAAPDGSNINEGCGALHPESLAAAVLDRGADLGIAFDGDADRAIFADATGAIRDGDDVLFLAARHRLPRGRLPGRVVVGTLMTNSGLEESLGEMGVRLVRAAVGDRYVLEAMEREGALVGGEPSGHLLFLDRAPAGDGVVTGLEVISMMRAAGQPLDAMAADRRRYPQVLVNVRLGERRPLEEPSPLSSEVARVRGDLHGHGRVLLRYSGTEPLLRVMVEAPSEETARGLAERLAEAARATLGPCG